MLFHCAVLICITESEKQLIYYNFLLQIAMFQILCCKFAESVPKSNH